MQKKIWFLMLIALLCFFPVCAFAEEEEVTEVEIDIGELIESAAQNVDLTEWQNIINSLELFPELSGGKTTISGFISGVIDGEIPLNTENLVNLLSQLLLSNVQAHAKIATIIFSLAVLAALAERMSLDLFGGTTSKVALTIIFCICTGLIVSSFSSILGDAQACISSMDQFVNIATPVLMVLVTAIGGAASSQIIHPSVIIIADIMTKLISNVIIPVLIAAAVLSFAHRLSDRPQFGNMATSLKRLSQWVIGIMFTLFTGFISIQKLASGALDGASLRAFKYTLSSFSLYGGNFLAKSVDVVSGCAAILKNILGSAGMIILLCICLAPAIQILAVSLVWRGCSLLLSALSHNKIADILNDIGSIYGTVFLCVATTAVLFFILISVVAGAGNSIFA